MTVSVVRS